MFFFVVVNYFELLQVWLHFAIRVRTLFRRKRAHVAHARQRSFGLCQRDCVCTHGMYFETQDAFDRPGSIRRDDGTVFRPVRVCVR